MTTSLTPSPAKPLNLVNPELWTQPGYYAELYRTTILENPYIPDRSALPGKTSDPQTMFLLMPFPEGMYGGQAGGGKSDALLMGALQYVHRTPDYQSLLLRRTYRDLNLPGALMQRSHRWLDNTNAKWHEKDHMWSFPKGSTLTFGYLEHDSDVFSYQSAEFQYIAFDELTQFLEFQYTFLFSRLRRNLDNANIPLRMRSASNPGGRGHAWVKEYFIKNGIRLDQQQGMDQIAFRKAVALFLNAQSYGRFTDQIADMPPIFVPARKEDNPALDVNSYRMMLSKLDPVTRAQQDQGDWDVTPGVGLYQEAWFQVVDKDELPRDVRRALKGEYVFGVRIVRVWDLAATDDPHADWTVGTLIAFYQGKFYVIDVRRMQGEPEKVTSLLLTTANLDGRRVAIKIEHEGGSAGKFTADHWVKTLSGFEVKVEHPSGNKVARGKPCSAIASNGLIVVVRDLWNRAWFDELTVWPFVEHDDQGDSLHAGIEALTGADAERWELLSRMVAPPLDGMTAPSAWSAASPLARLH